MARTAKRSRQSRRTARLDFAGIEWPLRPLARAAMGAMGVRAGDYRNWTAMEMWLRETVARLGRVA